MLSCVAALTGCFAFGLVTDAPASTPAQAAQKSSPAPSVAAPAPSVAEADETAAIIKASALGTATPPAACGEGGLALGDVVAVTGRHELRSAAESDAPRIKNEKATRLLKTPQYHVIDNSTKVRRLCVQDQWTKVRITSPDWLSDVSGWVPGTALRVIERTETGQQIFTEADFIWDTDTSQFKAQITTAVNRISAENPKCSPIDPGSVAKSPSRGTPDDPVFFVTCGTGAEAFNVWFRPDDAEAQTAFTAKAPLEKS